jgi:integrase
MDTIIRSEPDSQITQPWNKGKLTGAKPPLRPKHVWAVRTRLQLANRLRDLALFDLAIDSKLRGCDVVGLRVVDVAPHGYAVDRASIRQRKTGRPVRFEITEQTRQAIDDCLSQWGGASGSYLFPGRGSAGHLTTRQYARLLTEWLAMIGLDPASMARIRSEGRCKMRCRARCWHLVVRCRANQMSAIGTKPTCKPRR